MREILPISTSDIYISMEDVFLQQGLKRGKDPGERIKNDFHDALTLFTETAVPLAIYSSISADSFNSIYFGEGTNEPDTPVYKIFPKAEHLALFIVTLGDGLSRKIDSLFDSDETVLAYMLDTIASHGIESCASLLEQHIFNMLYSTKKQKKINKILRYSPGHCGWGIEGQRKIFDYLQPEDIDATLTDTYMILPMKSISGILITGEKDIHKFNNDYPFCTQCRTLNCRERMKNGG